METEGSLPHSQELATCVYLEPDQSSLDLSLRTSVQFTSLILYVLDTDSYTIQPHTNVRSLEVSNKICNKF